MIRSLFASLALLAASPAFAAEKMALIIGNDYAATPANGWNHLPNATHDVGLIAGALAQQRFEVSSVTNATRGQVEVAVQKFAADAANARIVVIYFAGHGFEYYRRTYLAAADSPLPDKVDGTKLPDRFVDLEALVSEVASVNSAANIVFVDACRTTGGVPMTVQGTGINSQINDIDFPEGKLIKVVYSAARGRPALDAAPPPQDYSPFAWAVAQNVAKPRVEVELLVSDIVGDVSRQTRDYEPVQQPYPYGIIGRGYFIGEDEAPAAAAAPATLKPIIVSDADLETIDAPLLTSRVLRDHSPSQVEAMARKGDPVANYFAGYMRLKGIGLSEDPKLALSYFEASAAANYMPGRLALAFALTEPGNSAKNVERGIALYDAAAKEGSAKAMARLGRIYWINAQDLKHRADYAKGKALLEQAADKGNPYAAYALSVAEPADGPHVVQLRALAKDNAAAREFLCDALARRSLWAEAVPLCRTAAEEGSALGQARLAIAYHDGLGVIRDGDEARHWVRLALSQFGLTPEIERTLRSYDYKFTIPAK
jgi:TPR repeat protein